MQYGVFRLRRRHFLVKRADDGGAPKNEWNEEFEDIITDTTSSPDPTTNSEIPNPEFSRISQSINQFLIKQIGENSDNICTFGIVSGSGEHKLELNVLALHDVIVQ